MAMNDLSFKVLDAVGTQGDGMWSPETTSCICTMGEGAAMARDRARKSNQCEPTMDLINTMKLMTTVKGTVLFHGMKSDDYWSNLMITGQI